MQAKNWWHIALVVAGSAVLTGCPFDKHTGCSDEEGLTTLKKIILESTNKELTERLGAEQNTAIKNALKSINLDIIGVRTIDKSSKNTQVFCEATLQISIPDTLITDANEALTLDGNTQTVKDILNNDDYQDNDDGTFDYEIGYTLQPSDDGKWIYAQIDEGEPEQGLGTLLYWSLSKQRIEAQTHAQNKQEADCQAQSLSVDGSFADQEIHRLNCEVERLDSRNEELGYY